MLFFLNNFLKIGFRNSVSISSVDIFIFSSMFQVLFILIVSLLPFIPVFSKYHILGRCMGSNIFVCDSGYWVRYGIGHIINGVGSVEGHWRFHCGFYGGKGGTGLYGGGDVG